MSCIGGQVTDDAKPKVGEDGWHCEPDCPFLDAKHEGIDGKCRKLGVDLMWYDYFIAACVEAGDEKTES